VIADQDIERLTAEIRARRESVIQRVRELTTRPIEIVAVTKGHPVEVAVAAQRAGFDSLGENYAQELVAKAADFETLKLPQPAWHFVGQLQSNKIRSLAPYVSVWESLDRASVLKELAKRSPGAVGYIQVDLAGVAGVAASRGGCDRNEVEGLITQATQLGLDIRGLMGVGMPGEPEESRQAFAWLSATAARLQLPEVSMGMSADMDVAIEEGATELRIGTALVGDRIG